MWHFVLWQMSPTVLETHTVFIFRTVIKGNWGNKQFHFTRWGCLALTETMCNQTIFTLGNAVWSLLLKSVFGRILLHFMKCSILSVHSRICHHAVVNHFKTWNRFCSLEACNSSFSFPCEGWSSWRGTEGDGASVAAAQLKTWSSCQQTSYEAFCNSASIRTLSNWSFFQFCFNPFLIVRFDVVIFCHVTLYSLVGRYDHSKGLCCALVKFEAAPFSKTLRSIRQVIWCHTPETPVFWFDWFLKAFVLFWAINCISIKLAV